MFLAPEGDAPAAGNGTPATTPSSVVPDVAATSGTDYKARSNELRDSLRTQNAEVAALRAELGQVKAQYEGVNVEAYNKIQDEITARGVEEERELIQQGQLEEVIKRRSAKYNLRKDEDIAAANAAAATASERNKILEAQLGEHYILQDLQKEVAAKGLRVRDGALPDVISRAKSNWRLSEDGKGHEAWDGDTRLYDENGQPLGMGDYVQEHLFRGASHLFAKGDGGGAGGSNSNTPTDGKLRILASDAAMRSRHIADIASGKAIVVDG